MNTIMESIKALAATDAKLMDKPDKNKVFVQNQIRGTVKFDLLDEDYDAYVHEFWMEKIK